MPATKGAVVGVCSCLLQRRAGVCYLRYAVVCYCGVQLSTTGVYSWWQTAFIACESGHLLNGAPMDIMFSIKTPSRRAGILYTAGTLLMGA